MGYRTVKGPSTRRWSTIATFTLISLVCMAFSPSARAQSPTSGSAPCNQPAPGSLKPTGDFTILPGATVHPLENPLRRGVKSPLVVLAFGDSAMWGNGLKLPYKYAYLVGKYVADGTGREVDLHTYAHSGANIANTDSCYIPIVTSDHGRAPGDLNAGLPTTMQQEASAAHAPEDYHRAELILLNGCINDVSAEKVALPFPFSLETPEQVTQLVKQWCSSDMLTLLKNTLHDFPLATVIVSNYWLIISDKSKPYGLEMRKPGGPFTPNERRNYLDYDSLLLNEIKAERLAGLHMTKSSALTHPKATLQRWSANSEAFLATTQACFDWAVATVDGKAKAAAGDTTCPPDTPYVEAQPVTQAVRTFLAVVSDDPDYSYGAGPKKREWSIPLGFARNDQMYWKRWPLCATHYRDALSLFICHVNPTAHPNVAGARAYQESITSILGKAWRTTDER